MLSLSTTVKMSKNKRLKEREIWRELQIVIKGYRALGFDYVIKRLPPARICFGSAMERHTMPLESEHMSPMMRRVLNKSSFIDRKRSQTLTLRTASAPPQLGYGPLASKVPRFVTKSSATGMQQYDPGDHITTVKQSWKPFGRAMTSKEYTSNTPGPGTYVDTHRRQYRFQHSFGGPLKVIPAVRIVCTPKPLARCHVCSELPRGEYFHNWRIAKTLCSICMFSAVQAATYRSRTTALKIRRLKDLNEFVKTRYCGFMHDHQGTKAKILLVSPKELTTKFRRENYLANFNI